MVDRDGERQRRDRSDERRDDRVADETVRGSVRNRRSRAAARDRARCLECGAEVEAGRRPPRPRVADGHARRAQEVEGEKRVAERAGLPGEDESPRGCGRRGRGPREAGRLPSARDGRRPVDAGRECREAAPRVARARDDIGPGHEIRAGRRAAPLDGAARERVDHPDGRDARQARGPRQAGGPPFVPGGRNDREAGRTRSLEGGRARGIIPVAEARSRRVVGEAQIDRVEVRARRVRDGPVDRREDVRGARRLAPVASAEDLQDDETGVGRDSLWPLQNAGDLGPVPAAVGEVGGAVRDVGSGPRAAARAPEVGMLEVDPAVHDRDTPAEARDADPEHAVRSDLRRPDLARGPDEPVETDVEDVGARRESVDGGGRREPGQDGRVLETAPRDEARRRTFEWREGLSPRFGRIRAERDEDRLGGTAPGESPRELRRHVARPRRDGPEDERGGRRETTESRGAHGKGDPRGRSVQPVCR